MLSSSLNLFTCAKPRLHRITTIVMAVFMMQVIAAGFCVTTASAAPFSMEVQHASDTDHCAGMNMDSAKPKSDKTEHACAHCDLPDVSVCLDKQASNIDYVDALFIFVALIPSTHALPVSDYQSLSPPLRTSLFTFDLNQRIRV